MCRQWASGSSLAGFMMPSQLLRPGRLALVLIVCAFVPAWAGECDAMCVASQAPALLNARLAQRTTVLCNEAYAALASDVTRGPLWSAEHLTAEGLAGARAIPREGRFHEEERLPPEDRAMLSDYVRAGYDRGHMAPSGDMPDPVAQQQSFSLANVVPQTPTLNRDIWEGIERAVRRLAERRGDLYVVTGPVFQGTQLQSLKGRVLVPTATWKAVYDPVARGAAAYICTHVRRPRCTTVSITALTREIGVDPFPGVPDAVKRTMMPLHAPEPSPYGASGRRGHHRPPQHSVFDGLLK
jgi:endonuclease G